MNYVWVITKVGRVSRYRVSRYQLLKETPHSYMVSEFGRTTRIAKITRTHEAWTSESDVRNRLKELRDKEIERLRGELADLQRMDDVRVTEVPAGEGGSRTWKSLRL